MSKKDGSVINEHVDKIKYRFGYQISETPKYKQVIDDSMEFDEVPEVIHATQDGQPMPNAGGGTDAYLEEQGGEEEIENVEDTPEEENNEELPVTEPSNAPAPKNVGDVPDEENNTPPESEEEPEQQDNTNPEKEANQIQNDIIKHNIDAMKSLQSKIEDLEKINSDLNNKLSTLDAEVDEVKEPTDAEKLMTKKDVSYPFYFNLNDFWQGNWFEKQREKAEEKGIRQLEDGTYVADFDDLQIDSPMDIDDSFN